MGKRRDWRTGPLRMMYILGVVRLTSRSGASCRDLPGCLTVGGWVTGEGVGDAVVRKGEGGAGGGGHDEDEREAAEPI